MGLRRTGLGGEGPCPPDWVAHLGGVDSAADSWACARRGVVRDPPRARKQAKWFVQGPKRLQAALALNLHFSTCTSQVKLWKNVMLH